jgi:hypothetical protein
MQHMHARARTPGLLMRCWLVSWYQMTHSAKCWLLGLAITVAASQRAVALTCSLTGTVCWLSQQVIQQMQQQAEGLLHVLHCTAGAVCSPCRHAIRTSVCAQTLLK